MKPIAIYFYLRSVILLAYLLTLFLLTACNMNTLPRNMSLKSFDPHRPDFMCRHETEFNPPVAGEAEDLFRQGMAATSYELIWPKDTRNFSKAAQLWQQAADQGHWKAAMNLAGLYEQGKGVPWDTEKAVQIVEALMKQGVPAAFDKMGIYHLEGTGVKNSVDRAYAFWQLAADMGSPSAQAYLGSKLDAAYDSPNQSFWGNREVALKMLECSYAQGNASGAYELGLTLSAKDGESPEYYARALQIYHDGVKFGSQQCANALNAEFDEITPFTGNAIDTARSDRYGIIADALRLNPDLRFPNLDKVLPLPPAKLPSWDGNPDTLIDAAKALVPLPDAKPTPGSQRTGRAHIPQDHVLAMPSPAPRSGPLLEVGAVVTHRVKAHVDRAHAFWQLTADIGKRIRTSSSRSETRNRL